MVRLVDQIPGLRRFVEKMEAGASANPDFRRGYAAGEVDIEGRTIPRSPATVSRLKEAKLQTGSMGFLGYHINEMTTSFLGGRPDAPDSFEWPTFNERRLTFIAQIDLADLPSHDLVWLPASGRLLYFVGQNEWDEYSSAISRVIYLPTDERSGRPMGQVTSRVCLQFEPRLTYAPRGPEDDVGQIDDNRELSDWYDGLVPRRHLSLWQVGGWPKPLQTSDMRQECERRFRGLPSDDCTPQDIASFRQELDTWHLLGQFALEGIVPSPSEYMRYFFWVKVEGNRALFDQSILTGQSD